MYARKLPSWATMALQADARQAHRAAPPRACASRLLNELVALCKGDALNLVASALVYNACPGLVQQRGLCHSVFAASPKILQACSKVKTPVPHGDAVVTRAYGLHYQYLVHAVVPQVFDEEVLSMCYSRALDVASNHRHIDSIVFGSLVSSMLGVNVQEASHVAVRSIREWCDSREQEDINLERIVIASMHKNEYDSLLSFMPCYFPPIEPSQE